MANILDYICSEGLILEASLIGPGQQREKSGSGSLVSWSPAPSPPAVACCSRPCGPAASAPWWPPLRGHRWPGHQAMAPPAFPNPPDPEDMSSRRWSWRFPAWAFVGNASVWRPCWPDSTPYRTRTAPPNPRM